MKKITPQQMKFVQEYLRSGNQTDAAIAAGYSEKSAASRASKLWEMPQVMEYRRELEEKLFKELGISEAWVGRRLAEIVERCMQGTPHLSWNPETRQKEPDGLWVFDPSGATKALHEIREQMGFSKKTEEETAARETFEDWLAKQGGSGL